jgi:DNA-binding CsgD family transcriptional regulator
MEEATGGHRAEDHQEETFAGLTVAASDALRDFMRQWMSLHAKQRDIIALRIAEPDAPMKRIADTLKISVQAVHQSLQRAAAGRSCPALLRVPLLFNRSDLFGGHEALHKARASALRILQEHGGSMGMTALIQAVKGEVGVYKAALVSIDRLVGEGVFRYCRGPHGKKAVIQMVVEAEPDHGGTETPAPAPVDS